MNQAYLQGGKDGLHRVLQGLGTEAAEFIRSRLAQAVEQYEQVIVLTHVPPFESASVHEGKRSGPDYMPYFCCKAVGDAIMDVARTTDSKIRILCGHTHSSGYVCIRENVEVVTGGSVYGSPTMKVLEV